MYKNKILYLPGVVGHVRTIITGLHFLLPAMSGCEVGGQFCCIVAFEIAFLAFQLFQFLFLKTK